MANLRRFAGTDVLAPGIVDYGVFENGVEWLVSDFVEGTLLSRIDVELPDVTLRPFTSKWDGSWA